MADGPTRYAHLSFNAPLSHGHAEALVERLAAAGPATVLDIGCGWAELLRRLLIRLPGASGLGIDDDASLLARASDGAPRNASFAASLDAAEPADLVVCCGSSQVFGTPAEALRELAAWVRPGGRLLFADGFWDARVTPIDDEVVRDMATLPDLPELVESAVAAGFRPLGIETSSAQEWEEFESGYLADWEHWLLEHPDDEVVRTRADTHRRRWLGGYRHGLGFAWLTLGRPAGT